MQKPEFPHLLFIWVLLKTGIALIFTLSVVFIPASLLLSAVNTIILWIWTRDKPSFVREKTNGRLVFTAIAEMIPFVEMFPTDVLFVLWTYHEEKRAYEKHLSGTIALDVNAR